MIASVTVMRLQAWSRPGTVIRGRQRFRVWLAMLEGMSEKLHLSQEEASHRLVKMCILSIAAPPAGAFCFTSIRVPGMSHRIVLVVPLFKERVSAVAQAFGLFCSQEVCEVWAMAP